MISPGQIFSGLQTVPGKRFPCSLEKKDMNDKEDTVYDNWQVLLTYTVEQSPQKYWDTTFFHCNFKLVGRKIPEKNISKIQNIQTFTIITSTVLSFSTVARYFVIHIESEVPTFICLHLSGTCRNCTFHHSSSAPP